MRAHTRFVSEGSYCSTLGQRDTEGQCQNTFKRQTFQGSKQKDKTMLKVNLHSIESVLLVWPNVVFSLSVSYRKKNNYKRQDNEVELEPRGKLLKTDKRMEGSKTYLWR